jgi:signal transduction histidine kinase
VTTTPESAKLLFRALRPPLRDRRFWVVQALVIVIAAFHEAADAQVVILPVGIPDFATVSLFLVPIIYAALNFGLTGSFATAVWVTLLSLPDFWWVDRMAHHWVDGLQLAIIDTVAVLVGVRVEDERLARMRAEEAQVRAAAYAAQVIQAQEEERRRLAHWLHDDPLQALILASRQLEAGGPGHTAKETKELVDSVAVTLRSISQSLRPPILDDLGLRAGIRRLVEDFGRRSGIQASFESEGAERRLDPNVELNLYRIAQEALNNVEKHAAARVVRVRLEFGRERVRLSVGDDGIGFEPGESTGVDGHLGLLGMEERAALLGGALGVRSSEGRGTTITAQVPLAQAAHVPEGPGASVASRARSRWGQGGRESTVRL